MWWSRRDLNPQQANAREGEHPRILPATPWWTDGESNPDLCRARAVCSRYHYRPVSSLEAIMVSSIPSTSSSCDRNGFSVPTHVRAEPTHAWGKGP